MTHLSVPEWGRAPVGPQGFTTEQAQALVNAACLHPLGGEDGTGILSDHRHYLRAGQMVGVLTAPGCSLEILPKVDPETPEEDAPTVRRHLITLLDLALGLDIGAGSTTTITHGAENLLEILIRIFAERLLTEARRGLPRLYLPHADDLSVLRGRLDVVRQFTHHAVRPDRLACRYDQLSSDIPLLQVMKSAVWLLRRLSRMPETQRLLDELRFLFADVRSIPVPSLPWDRIRIDRSNRRWKSLMALAGLLVRRDWQSTAYASDSGEGVSLLFPMNELFEGSITTLLRRTLTGLGIEVIAQGGMRYCLGTWSPEEDCSGRVFQTRPDILLRRGGRIIAIIDTKWKCLSTNPVDRKRGVSQADIYQMMAYARLYRCDRLMLLYPARPGEVSEGMHRYGLDGGREMLGLGKVDLSSSPHDGQSQLMALMNELCLTSPITKTVELMA